MSLKPPRLAAFGFCLALVWSAAPACAQTVLRMPDDVPVAPSRAPQSVKAAGAHGCAVFGGSSESGCADYPDWQSGTWQAPDGVESVQVLVVGGGGGGGASIERGIGGSGGGSGQLVIANAALDRSPIDVRVGQAGQGGLKFRQAGRTGGASSFGTIQANGGGGGSALAGGNAAINGNGDSGGGGGGGGNYQPGAHGGAGGAGGSGGGDGANGAAGTDATQPVRGTVGGVGHPFPDFGFKDVVFSPGKGGQGGAPGGGGVGFGGGGGGGGGGLLINAKGAKASPGASGPAPGSGDMVGGGAGGAGYGAGGGGGGNFRPGAPGGDGAPGLVYLEW